MRRLSLSPIGTPGAWLRLMRVDRPVGYWLLLWPTWIGLFAAPGRFSWRHFALFTLGVFVMRSAGCVINDFADRGFDPHVARTRTRPIAAGEIAPAAALVGFALLLLVALAIALMLPKRVLWLAVPTAALAAIYPFTKRWWDYPQLVLGIAFGWGGLMAWAAEGGALSAPEPWLLLAANLCWTMAYDTAYALADRADDEKIGVRS
ncbi:MAG: 4-hydroxybenzoate octaprenyltransferase, partial [Zetaproteobacteria bacterium]